MDIPSFTEFFGMKVASTIAKRKERKEFSIPLMQSLIRFALHVAGFSCLTYGAFTFNILAGFITAGVSCFAFSWLFTGSGESTVTKATYDPMTMRNQR